MASATIDSETYRASIDFSDPAVGSYAPKLFYGIFTHGVRGLMSGKRLPQDKYTLELLGIYHKQNPPVWHAWAPIIATPALLTLGFVYYRKQFGHKSSKFGSRVVSFNIAFWGTISASLLLTTFSIHRVCPTPQTPHCQYNRQLKPYYKNTIMPIEYAQNQVWIQQIPLEMDGIMLGAKMEIINLQNESNSSNSRYHDNNDDLNRKTKIPVLVYSPLELTKELENFIKSKNFDIKYIISPNCLHILFVEQWKRKFPNAKLIGAPNCDKRLNTVNWDYIVQNDHDRFVFNKCTNNCNLKQTSDNFDSFGSFDDFGYDEFSDGDDNDVFSDLLDTLDLVLVKTGIFHEEIVLYHKKNKLLIVGDHIVNWGYLPDVPDWKVRYLFRLAGMDARPSVPIDFKLSLDEKQYKQSVEKVLQFDFHTILCSHGRIIENGAKDIYRMANAFVL